jgi:hypothetical protein
MLQWLIFSFIFVASFEATHNKDYSVVKTFRSIGQTVGLYLCLLMLGVFKDIGPSLAKIQLF